MDDNFVKILIPVFIPFVSLRVMDGSGVGVLCAYPSPSPKVSIDLAVIKLT